MNRNYMYPLIAVILLFLIAYVGVEAAGLAWLFGIVLPYAAFVVFIGGVVYRMLDWGNSAVPFAIPTTGGQQKSLAWIESAKFDNPSTTAGVVVRMFLEIVFFRTLFRNTRMKLKQGPQGPKLAYHLEIFLWVGAIAFHYAFLTVLVRHLRFFLEPVPFAIQALENLDSFFRIEVSYDFLMFGMPGFYLSGLVLLAAVTYLALRRILIPSMKYMSLASDFFPLFLIFGIALSGIVMRYFAKVDITAVKTITMGLVTFHPTIPDGVGGVFYVHLFFVTVLLLYFPFSKLMHLGGIFLSPTRNMRTNTREVRHVNPWNYPVPVHTYDEYEDEFRDKMVEVGLPVEKEPESSESNDTPVNAS